MNETYHFYASSLLDDGFNPEDRDRDDRVYRRFAINDLEGLRAAFDQILSEGKRIDRLLIETHGSSGAIYFGDQALTFTNIYSWLGHRGYENPFNYDGFIYIDGCNVAEWEQGRNFLQRFGGLFFKLRGGTCGAWTSTGYTNFLTGDKTWHPFGKYIKVKFPGGGKPQKVFMSLVGIEMDVEI